MSHVFCELSFSAVPAIQSQGKPEHLIEVVVKWETRAYIKALFIDTAFVYHRSISHQMLRGAGVFFVEHDSLYTG